MNATGLEQLAREGFTRVPVVRRLLADLETPLGAYLKFAGPFSFLFESVEGGEKWGRYSIIGLPCRRRLVVRDGRITLCDGGAEQDAVHADPLAFVEEFLARERALPHEDLPMFAGGLVGYFGYDCVRMVEPRLAASAPPDALGTPDILLMVAEEFLVFDNLAGAILLVVTVDPRNADAASGAQGRLDELQRRLEGPAPRLPPVDIDAVRRDSQRVRDVEAAFESEFGRERFEAALTEAKNADRSRLRTASRPTCCWAPVTAPRPRTKPWAAGWVGIWASTSWVSVRCRARSRGNGTSSSRGVRPDRLIHRRR